MDVSAAGLLNATRALLYAASYEQDPGKLRTIAPDGLLVLTDSNRRRALRWSGIVGNYGYTEVAGEKPVAPVCVAGGSQRRRWAGMEARKGGTG